MLVDRLLRLIGQWARNTGSVAFALLLFDAVGLAWKPERPGLRLAVVLGVALVGAAFQELTRSKDPRVEGPT